MSARGSRAALCAALLALGVLAVWWFGARATPDAAAVESAGRVSQADVESPEPLRRPASSAAREPEHPAAARLPAGSEISSNAAGSSLTVRYEDGSPAAGLVVRGVEHDRGGFERILVGAGDVLGQLDREGRLLLSRTDEAGAHVPTLPSDSLEGIAILYDGDAAWLLPIERVRAGALISVPGLVEQTFELELPDTRSRAGSARLVVQLDSQDAFHRGRVSYSLPEYTDADLEPGRVGREQPFFEHFRLSTAHLEEPELFLVRHVPLAIESPRVRLSLPRAELRAVLAEAPLECFLEPVDFTPSATPVHLAPRLLPLRRLRVVSREGRPYSRPRELRAALQRPDRDGEWESFARLQLSCEPSPDVDGELLFTIPPALEGRPLSLIAGWGLSGNMSFESEVFGAAPTSVTIVADP